MKDKLLRGRGHRRSSTRPGGWQSAVGALTHLPPHVRQPQHKQRPLPSPPFPLVCFVDRCGNVRGYTCSLVWFGSVGWLSKRRSEQDQSEDSSLSHTYAYRTHTHNLTFSCFSSSPTDPPTPAGRLRRRANCPAGVIVSCCCTRWRRQVCARRLLHPGCTWNLLPQPEVSYSQT